MRITLGQPYSFWRKRQKSLSSLLLSVLIGLTCFSASSVGAALQELPSLGDSASSIVSLNQEYVAGRAWLRMLRGQAPIVSDPLLNEYITHLTYHLASYSELDQRQLEIVIINNSAINAFAVPGGVLGINAGLLLHAETEAELAAVLAHEIAHLSQRHFARNVEKSRRSQWTTVAALIASVALLASGDNADAGMAALLTTQAASLQSQLSFSRQNEREADRFGMVTLANAGKDPSAMPRFFERLHKATRTYSEAPPEFLLTHPVTESRISDSYNRVMQLPAAESEPSLDFALMKARVEASYAEDRVKNISRFEIRARMAKDPISKTAAQYGLVRTLLKNNKYEDAITALKPLRNADPNRVIYMVTESEILMAQAKYIDAQKVLEAGLAIVPDSYALQVYHAQVLLRTNNPERATAALENLLLERPSNPQLWRLLSEAHGATGNIVGVHEARAEVFFLHNRNDQAIQQLKYALTLTKENFQRSAKIKRRMMEIQKHKSDLRV